MSLPDAIPEIFRAGACAAAAAIRQIDHVLIAAHVNPDGDAAGAMAAAGHILHRLGKQFCIYAPTGIPAYLDFLPMPGPVLTSLTALPFAPQAAIYADCSDAPRLGPELTEHAGDWPSVNIDHHICAAGLGSLANCICPQAAATCQLMAYVAQSLGLPLAGLLAHAIGLGIITDTGNFCHGNSSAEVFELAAELTRGGVSLPSVNEQLRSHEPLRKFRLWGLLFDNIALAMNGKVAWVCATEEEFAKTGAQNEDLEGFAEMLRRIDGVKIAMLIKQTDANMCKFSLRSKAETNVQAIAARAGGGGHKNAAGGSIAAPPVRAAEILLALIAASFAETA